MALEIKDLGVKFYSSKSKAEALTLASLPGDAAEPGAICFVSDETGNFIILNGKFFGSGAPGGSGSGSGSGSGGGGAVDSVNGKTGVVVLTLSDLAVASIDGQVVYLSDYFDNQGRVISNSFVVTDENNGLTTEVVSINKNGITINNSRVATQNWVEDYVSTIQLNINNSIDNRLNLIENQLEQYADSIITSVYKPKGSVLTYSLLLLIENPSIGDVYNVVAANGNVPAGTNYVYLGNNEWDALGGTVNLSAYKTSQEVDAAINTALNASKTYIDTAVSGLTSTVNTNSTNISNLILTTNTHTTQLANAEVNITLNTTNINKVATQLTWQ